MHFFFSNCRNDYYHAHEFCLQRLRKCKVCSTPFIEQAKPPTTQDKIHAFIVLHSGNENQCAAF